MNKVPEKYLSNHNMRWVLILSLIWSSCMTILLCWGIWMEYQVDHSGAMDELQVHLWRWSVSLFLIWILVLYFIGLVARRMAEGNRALELMSSKLNNNALVSSRREAFCEAIYNSITDGVVFTDNQNCISMTNPAFTKLTGYTSKEVKDQNAEFLFTNLETFRDKGEDLFQAVSEMEFSLKDGSVVPMETIGAHVKGTNGKILGNVLILRDISRRKLVEKEQARLETKLIQSYKMEAIGTLAGGIAHDFNNILGIILVNTDMALEDIPEGNPARTNVERIVQASTRARNLVDQILVYSRQVDKKLIPLMPGPLVKESLKFLRSTSPASVKIIQHINDEFRAILMDPAQLQQLLLNLFSNAVRAVCGIGTVEVIGTVVERYEDDVNDQHNIPPGQYFKLNIRDTGVGMDRETQKRIFDPFYTTLKVGEGTGMGLATAMGIVRSHGGYIWVDSEPGSGTVVEIFFPIFAILEEDQGEDIESLQGTERVLFVDDEIMLVDMASMFLRRQGFKVTEKTNSLQALETFRSRPDEFDIVITDQTMPEMTGSELAIEMFKIRPDVPVILLSGYSKKISEDDVKKLGIKDFLHKPFHGKAMVRSIRAVLDE